MICKRLDHIMATMRKAAAAAGRSMDSIHLVAVSKMVEASRVAEAMRCGQLVFGENYLQEAQHKIPLLPATAQWHFIGRMQSNKCGPIAALFHLVETVDRVKIAELLNQEAERLGKVLPILVQVNTGGEAQKAGCAPEEVELLLERLHALPHLRPCGLMTMPPWNPDPEQSRPHFRLLRRLAEHCAEKGLFAKNAPIQLSMGMSADYVVAIEEGATIVRIGSALFGDRKAPNTASD